MHTKYRITTVKEPNLLELSCRVRRLGWGIARPDKLSISQEPAEEV